ncbi:MAG: RNA polymerase factor sigma-54 [Pirellulaceae bacterium]|nr:RNA polymerase factor sigma-54 [Planctomycetales bacterium]
MRLSFGLEQKLVQKQILAPRMIQSMEVLQLPIQALEAHIEAAMNENPVLEALDRDPDAPDEQFERDNPDAPADTEKELVVDESKDNVDDFERLLEMDSQIPDHFDELPRVSANRIEESSDRKHDAIANIATRSETLQEVLIRQIHELDLDDDLVTMAERIISSLDSNGWLPGAVEDLMPLDSTPEQIELARQALSIIQQLDPPGVGARDLRECLLLQLRPDMPMYEEQRALIADHLPDLVKNSLPAIQRKTGYTIERIKEAWDELRKLNPKPGAIYSEVVAPTIVPDVFLEQDEHGRYVVKLEDGRTPSLRISKFYRQRLMNGEATPEEREYIKRKVNAAQWLIESIEQRRSTLTRVAQAIVDHQSRFLDEGPECIEPLKMQQIADKVGVHVTTVSRAVDDKWIQTPRGIFPLRNFFVGGTTSADGEEVAWDAIRIKLQEIVDHENKQEPYSDDDLVKQLANHGLTVARRTVTKYRKKMGIPSSRQRREWTSSAS